MERYEKNEKHWRRVLKPIWFHEKGITTKELAEITGLTRAQVYESVRDLVGMNIVRKKRFYDFNGKIPIPRLVVYPIVSSEKVIKKAIENVRD